MQAELEDMARRMEQQLLSYEKLHADEIKRFEEQLQAFQRIQSDELQMLCKELDRLKQEIAALKQEGPNDAASMPSPAGTVQREPVVTRRDLLTGKIPVSNPRGS